MKYILNYFAIIIAALSLIQACTFDELDSIKPFEEGIPVNISLRYKVDESPIYTKAAQDDVSENQVNNLYIFIFDQNGNRMRDENGELITDLFFTTFDSYNGYNPKNPTEGTVSFSALTANNARIVGIANITYGTTTTSFTVTKDQLDAITTYDELSDFVMPLREESVERNALFMMTGVARTDESDKINITPDGNLNCTLELRRIDAKIEVNIKAVATDGISDITFEPKTWKILRIPKQSLLLPYMQTRKKTETSGPWQDGETDAWDASSGEFSESYNGFECGWFNTTERPFEKTDITVGSDGYTKHTIGGSFVFYMPENLRKFTSSIRKNKPNLGQTEKYALREERIPGNPVDDPSKPGQEYTNDGDFLYADPYSTYMELTGFLTYTNEDNVLVNADVKYTVHLGSDITNADDYDTRRNGHYIYNITIQGAKSIYVEVNNRNEQRPGYEGDLYYSLNKVFELDSHYDRCLLSLDPDIINDFTTWSVKTYFNPSGFIYSEGEDISTVDYQWIKFAVNSILKKQLPDKVPDEKAYAYFPGEMTDKQYNPDWNPNNGWTYGEWSNMPYVLNIHQLIELLKLAKNENFEDLIPAGESSIVITAFVDENVYIRKPGENTPNLLLWKQMVETDDRQMHIITPEENEQIYSQDGSSSMVKSTYSFMQKAIRTIYNNNEYSSVQKAWGLESVMEATTKNTNDSLRLNPDQSKYSQKVSSTSDGRYNTWSLINSNGTLYWNDIVDNFYAHKLKDGFKSAVYACLLRNRDLNGDNMVDPSELRWYLAAIDQLKEIYIGQNALDEASWLYPRNDMYRPSSDGLHWHYTSSSYDKSGNGPWVLWAEEGASIGTYDVGEDYDSKSTVNNLYAYRCIRNLGFDIETEQDIYPNSQQPDQLIKVDESSNADEHGNKFYLIDLSNMNPNALRTFSDGGESLPAHDHNNANNRPYSIFTVDSDISGMKEGPLYTVKDGEKSDYSYIKYEHLAEFNWNDDMRGRWDQYYSLIKNRQNPCPDGFRLPNQRELLIMTSNLTEDQWPVYTETGTSWRGYWKGPFNWAEESFLTHFNDMRPKVLASGIPYFVIISQTAFAKGLHGDEYDDTNYKNRGGFIWNYYDKAFMLQNYSDGTYPDHERGYVRCVRDGNHINSASSSSTYTLDYK